MEAGWQRACREAASTHELAPEALRLLLAFAPPDGEGPGAREGEIDPFAAWTRAPSESFEALESAAEASAPALRAALIERLGLTLRPAHAEDYARRFETLRSGLSELPGFEARLLRLALSARLSEVLGRAERLAPRARDVIDFYHGHASALMFGGPAQATPGELARAATFREVGPGIELAQVEGLATIGPLRMHLLRVRGAHLRALHLGPAAAPLEALVSSAGAGAGISGGYVLCSDRDLEAPSRHADPVGLVVSEGNVISPPVFPRACLLEGPAGIEIRVVGPVGLQVRLGGVEWTVAALNDASALAAAPVAFNRVWGPMSPEHEGVSLALLGRRLIRAGRGALAIPKAGLVLALPRDAEMPEQGWKVGAEADLDAEAGEEVRYTLPFEVWSAMAGGPMLLSEGGGDIDLRGEQFVPEVPPYTFAADETQDQNLLPRMVAGLSREGDLVVAAIDGRNFRRGVGMTLGQCRDLLSALGCTRAMNLDGGDSKRMVVEGRVVDLPGSQLEWDRGEPGGPDASQLAVVRPVFSAILFGATRPADGIQRV